MQLLAQGRNLVTGLVLVGPVHEQMTGALPRRADVYCVRGEHSGGQTPNDDAGSGAEGPRNLRERLFR